jgi:hypothetical protein
MSCGAEDINCITIVQKKTEPRDLAQLNGIPVGRLSYEGGLCETGFLLKGRV